MGAIDDIGTIIDKDAFTTFLEHEHEVICTRRMQEKATDVANWVASVPAVGDYCTIPICCECDRSIITPLQEKGYTVITVDNQMIISNGTAILPTPIEDLPIPVDPLNE
jgi:hypothetical protein